MGIAETNLMKAIAQSTGRTLAQIKSDAQTTGDLGIVAEQSRSMQRMIFKPMPLTVRSVFEKLKEIAKMVGHAVSLYNFDGYFSNILFYSYSSLQSFFMLITFSCPTCMGMFNLCRESYAILFVHFVSVDGFLFKSYNLNENLLI